MGSPLTMRWREQEQELALRMEAQSMGLTTDQYREQMRAVGSMSQSIVDMQCRRAVPPPAGALSYAAQPAVTRVCCP